MEYGILQRDKAYIKMLFTTRINKATDVDKRNKLQYAKELLVSYLGVRDNYTKLYEAPDRQQPPKTNTYAISTKYILSVLGQEVASIIITEQMIGKYTDIIYTAYAKTNNKDYKIYTTGEGQRKDYKKTRNHRVNTNQQAAKSRKKHRYL